MTPLWLALAFLCGLGVGALWREAFEILREGDPMRTLRRLLHVRIPVLTVALMTSMLFTAAVGVGVILNDRESGRTLECTVQYNSRTAQARDERLAAQVRLTTAEVEYVREDLAYQRGLLRSLSDDVPLDQLTTTIRTRITANETYLQRLLQQEQVRVANEYPPADLCRGLR